MVEQRDPEVAETELRMSKDINMMPENVRDRFKALKVLHDSCVELDAEEEKAFRAIELKYEVMYQEVYKQRAQLLAGTVEPSAEQLEQYTFREGKLKDDKFADVELDKPCDVKAILASSKGVCDFWPRVLESNGNTNKAISDKDRPIIGYCNNVEAILHTEDHGFTIKMNFEVNQYFEGTELSASFYMKKSNQLDKVDGSTISWKAGCDPTHQKKTKKKKGKKITTTEKVPSFFDLFASHVSEEQPEDEDDEAAQAMDAALDLAQQIKDQCVPLALELYMGVVEFDDEDDDEEDDDDDMDNDEDEGPPAKGKGLGAKGSNAPPKGKDGKECKQQ